MFEKYSKEIKALANAKPKELKSFGIIFSIGIAILLYAILPFTFGIKSGYEGIILSLIILLLSLIYPLALVVLYVPWMIIGGILGYINTRIILSFLYFFMIIPVSFLSKIFREDPLRKKIDKNLETYRLKPGPNPNNLEKPY